jgi:hypothetical protein
MDALDDGRGMRADEDNAIDIKALQYSQDVFESSLLRAFPFRQTFIVRRMNMSEELFL